VQPLLLAERMTSSSRASLTRSASWTGSTTNRSIVPTKPPDRTDGRRARTAPPTTILMRLRDEDTGLRQVHELTQQIPGVEWAGVALGTKVRVAQGDETIDIGDTGGSDQVFHAEGSHLAGRRPCPSTGASHRPWAGTDGPSIPGRHAVDAAAPGRGRPVLHSGRRCI
jgi:hypothetical protein